MRLLAGIARARSQKRALAPKDRAARIIQRLLKSRAVAHDIAVRVTQSEVLSAEVLEAVVRGSAQRELMSTQEEAATVIQGLIRGRAASKHSALLLSQTEVQAAGVLGSAARGKQSRQWLDQLDKAARKLQGLMVGWAASQITGFVMEEEEDNAADVLGAVARGRAQRRLLARQDNAAQVNPKSNPVPVPNTDLGPGTKTKLQGLKAPYPNPTPDPNYNPNTNPSSSPNLPLSPPHPDGEPNPDPNTPMRF